ncbi:hypothetical protein [Pelosinus sp. UFO1]|uniref:hypothetical protein n=1 Tax=Pelosinus sp. UFO1 TaxID=484770 RepID=UPI0004D163A7|nr:hypothetical protein [Pelosinus sp. UFO1]AIF50445.1 hypothetical protein UFO1_0890 [Pelosinus sp. UFO1]
MNSNKKKMIASILLLVFLTALSGCASFGAKSINETTQQKIGEPNVNKDKAIVDEFKQMTQRNDFTTEELIKFINETISVVSSENASKMILTLEKNQQLDLTKLEEKYGNDKIQEKIAKNFRGDFSESYINSIQDKVIKDLLLETKNKGLKIETAEGFYFPVIDYSFYKKYQSNLTSDIAAYIDIMSVESDKVAVKDAGLMISWDEVVKRATNQEGFIKEFSNSAKKEDVKTLLKRYLIVALYGTNNTPLFSYEDKLMIPAAKKSYLETIPSNGNEGSFSRIMSDYLTLVKKNDYKLTQEVDEYRKTAIEGF